MSAWTSNENISVHFYLLMPGCKSGWKGYIRMKSVDPQFFSIKSPARKEVFVSGLCLIFLGRGFLSEMMINNIIQASFHMPHLCM